jgi:hypothetical protein
MTPAVGRWLFLAPDLPRLPIIRVPLQSWFNPRGQREGRESRALITVGWV